MVLMDKMMLMFFGWDRIRILEETMHEQEQEMLVFRYHQS